MIFSAFIVCQTETAERKAAFPIAERFEMSLPGRKDRCEHGLAYILVAFKIPGLIDTYLIWQTMLVEAACYKMLPAILHRAIPHRTTDIGIFC